MVQHGFFRKPRKSEMFKTMTCEYATVDDGYCFDCARYGACKHSNKAPQAEINKRKNWVINQ
jgi:hypothetical protein